ncbi:vitamin B12-dependent ribonucleotide reductase [Rubrobacter aplysinae]|uniref:vitamin B12-dependent ribonucleotide reductase n=1 Tax=Rubrobacter aplysinae TaxID=909625 RepID=UPI000A6D6808|nr:vitamin B12-dependent ribonucleotide reductase [Rubrobacter aplysinae]
METERNGRNSGVSSEARDEIMQLSDNAVAVLKKRYLKKDESGEPTEEPMDMFLRVASNIAEGEYRFKRGEEAEELYERSREQFLRLMTSRKFMPNSPTLMNAGRELQQLSACFVLPVEDSIDGIYDTLKHQAVIHKSGGGTGFGFSKLRPKNDIVKSTMGVSSGPVSFMAIYDASTDKIKQGGTRRGANMGILRVDHPDIEEFISCKRDNDQINNFNISVAITDEFMEAVESDSEFALRNPRDGEVHSMVNARDLFGEIVEGAWLNGEPGVVFIDRINDDNPTPQFPIESTNPCSEAHLPPYDSCNLGSINLVKFVENPGASMGAASGESTIDWDGLRETVRTSVRFLDNVIEQNSYPLAEIDAMSRGNRRIGLGVMGFADALIKLGITYDSEEGLAFAEKVMKFVDDEAWEASRHLADERGVMPNYEGTTHEQRGDLVRNATVTTIAPTGTISMIAGCSGGIEPLFAVAFMRRQADMELPDVNPEFVALAKERGFYSEDLMKQVAEHGSVRDIPGVPEDVQNVWVTSHDIGSDWHVRMQAAFQKYTSMGISKTINLPNEADTGDVGDAYLQAYRTGCKGIAVYRDGSREAQVLSTGSTGSTGKSEAPEEPPTGAPADANTGNYISLAEARNGRPRTLSGVTKKLQTGHGQLYVTMNDDEFGPRECFVVIGKPGGTASAFSDALGRMISLAMTHGASPEEVHHQLRGIQDGHPAGVGPSAILSVPDGVAKAIGEHYMTQDEQRSGGAEARELPVIGACPDCGSGLTRQEGCVTCFSCGYSKCS